MPQTKWSVEEIEAMRLQLNQLQQQLEQQVARSLGVRKLSKLWLSGVAAAVKSRLSSETSSNPQDSSFFSKNPNFKPYTIRLQKPRSAARLPKVLHVIPIFTTGGSQQLVVDLIEGLSDQYVHEVVVRQQHPEQGYVGVPIYHCPYLDDKTGFLPLLASVKPDIVHVHYWGEWKCYAEWKWYHNIFQASIHAGCQVVENCNNPLMPYLHEGIARYAYVSEYARDTFGISNLPNQVIYPGSNFYFFQRADSQPDPDTIGMVYRLDRDKLNEYSIDPLIKAVQKRPTTKALVVGGGYYLELFKQKVAEAGLTDRFTFPGYVAYEALAQYYRQMAIFVAPVHKESFGQVTPFAMNMEIPVVAYNVGALEEMLVKTDVLAPPQDSEGMANIIVELLNDPVQRQMIGAFNKERAVTLFSVESMVEAYSQLYKSLL